MESINVEVDGKWARLIRSPAYHVVNALSGVAVTFLPMYLHRYGREGLDYFDWRVVVCWLTIVLVTVVHFRLSAPVMRALRAAPKPERNNQPAGS